jgi:hypothetical protein
MKPQPGRTQPMLFNPFTFWTDMALKTGEIMLASAHAVERKAKSGEFAEPAATLTRRTVAIIKDINGRPRRPAKSNGLGKRKAKSRSKR